jgi:hypothetical protein
VRCEVLEWRCVDNVCLFAILYAYRYGGILTKLKLKRKSYFVDERTIRRAQKALGVKTEAEVIRAAVERLADMEEFWNFMNKSKGTAKPKSFMEV